MTRTQTLNRRAFIGALVGAGALAVPLARSVSAAASVQAVYRLNPNWGAGDAACLVNPGGSSCSGCSACVNHANNKLFATAAAADTGRAHPGCKCRVETACNVDSTTYDQLFNGASSVDLRTPGVSARFVCAPTAPVAEPTHPDTEPDPGGGGGTAPDGNAGGQGGGHGSSGGANGNGTGGSANGGTAPSALAVTGSASPLALSDPGPLEFARTGANVGKLALTGAAMAAIGAVILRVRSRNPEPDRGHASVSP